MTANKLYKQTGSSLPFSEWLGQMKLQHGEDFLEKFKYEAQTPQHSNENGPMPGPIDSDDIIKEQDIVSRKMVDPPVEDENTNKDIELTYIEDIEDVTVKEVKKGVKLLDANTLMVIGGLLILGIAVYKSGLIKKSK